MSSTCKVCLPLLLFIWCFCTFVYNVLIWFTLIYKTESTHVNILYYFLMTWIQCYCKVIHSSDVSVTWNWIFFFTLNQKVYGKFNMANFLKSPILWYTYFNLEKDDEKLCSKIPKPEMHIHNPSLIHLNTFMYSFIHVRIIQP